MNGFVHYMCDEADINEKRTDNSFALAEIKSRLTGVLIHTPLVIELDHYGLGFCAGPCASDDFEKAPCPDFVCKTRDNDNQHYHYFYPHDGGVLDFVEYPLHVNGDKIRILYVRMCPMCDATYCRYRLSQIAGVVRGRDVFHKFQRLNVEKYMLNLYSSWLELDIGSQY